MTNSKIHNRISKLEQASKIEHIDYIFIPAVNGETDLEAIEKRFYKPFFPNYNILVFRRSDNGFIGKLYDKAKNIIDDKYNITPPDQDINGYYEEIDKQALLSYFDGKLRQISG